MTSSEGELIMKEKITKFFQRLQPGFAKVGNNRYLQSIMGAMMATLGPMILGSFATLLSVYATQWHWTQVAKISGNVNVVTIGCIALYVAFLMGKNIAKEFLNDDDRAAAGIISLMSFLIITPLGKVKSGAFIPSTWLGASGLFSAMILQLVLSPLLWYPWFRMADKKALAQEQAAAKK